MPARTHISLEVADLDAAIRFYSLVFRTVPTKQRDDYANYRLERPGLHLALEHIPDRASGNPYPNQHFGVELFEGEELLEWRNWLQAVGVDYVVEEQVTCCYAVADKFWLTDPDGHRWEFWVRTDEADLMHGEMASQVDAIDSTIADCCMPSTQTGGAIASGTHRGKLGASATAPKVSTADNDMAIASVAASESNNSGCCG